MMNRFNLPIADWAFIAGVNATGTHLFLGRQLINTSPPSKDFNLCGEVEVP